MHQFANGCVSSGGTRQSLLSLAREALNDLTQVIPYLLYVPAGLVTVINTKDNNNNNISSQLSLIKLSEPKIFCLV